MNVPDPSYEADVTYEREKALELRQSNGALKLKRLRPIHRTMIFLHLEGHSISTIASRVDRSYVNVQLILNDPLAQHMIDRSIQDAQAQLKALQIKAVDCIHNAMTSKLAETQLKGVDRMVKLSEHLGIGANTKETAEDVVQKILSAIKIDVNINSGAVSTGRIAGSHLIEGENA